MAKKLKFGVIYSLHAGPGSGHAPSELYSKVADWAAHTEGLGYDAMFFSEHHMNEEADCPSPLMLMAAAAAKTERITLGTSVIVAPLYHPVKLAEDVAVLDNISGGRIVLGIGMGYRESEFQAFGVPFNQKRGRLEETIDILTKCWTEDKFDYSGKYFDLKGVSVYPKPVQKPHPRLWMGATSKPALARAARYGMPTPTSAAPIEAIRRQKATYIQALADHGRSPDDVDHPLLRDGFIAETDEEAWSTAKPYIMNLYQGDYARSGAVWATDPDTGKWRQYTDPNSSLFTENDGKGLIEDRLLVGSPETCIREIERYQSVVPTTVLLVRMMFPGMAPETAMRSAEIFARDVIPAFR